LAEEELRQKLKIEEGGKKEQGRKGWAVALRSLSSGLLVIATT